MRYLRYLSPPRGRSYAHWGAFAAPARAQRDRCEARDDRELLRSSGISDKQPKRIHDLAQDRLDLFEECVDDAVFANGHAIGVSRSPRLSLNFDVEGDDHGFGRHRQVDVVDVDVSQTGVDNFGAGLRLIAELFE